MGLDSPALEPLPTPPYTALLRKCQRLLSRLGSQLGREGENGSDGLGRATYLWGRVNVLWAAQKTHVVPPPPPQQQLSSAPDESGCVIQYLPLFSLILQTTSTTRYTVNNKSVLAFDLT